MPLGYESSRQSQRRHNAESEWLEQHRRGSMAPPGPRAGSGVMDRGMAGEDNVEFLREGGRRYIVGTAKTHCASSNGSVADARHWRLVTAGLGSADHSGAGAARSFHPVPERRAGRHKSQAMHDGVFEKAELKKASEEIQTSCPEEESRKPVRSPHAWAGCWGRNTRAAALFEVKVESGCRRLRLVRWKLEESGTRLSRGCYVLRSNVTELESGRSVAGLHPVDRQPSGVSTFHSPTVRIPPGALAPSVGIKKEERVRPHPGLAFWPTCSWKTLAAELPRGRTEATNDTPASVRSLCRRSRWVDVGCPTRSGRVIAAVHQPAHRASAESCSQPARTETAQRAGRAAM